MTILIACAVAAALWLTPFPIAPGGPASVEFVDRNGQPLRTLLVEEKRFARSCRLAEVSPRLIEATISAEDKRFRFHWGIDPLALGRAVWTSIGEKRAESGASTITQQLIKLTTPGPRTIGRKIREVWLAARVECSWSKDRILEEYLNRLDYGNLQCGIASASRYYFGKPPADLDAAEAAFLAGLPKAPGRLDPHANLSAARARQAWVLARMDANGMLSASERARAQAEPLLLLPPGREFAAPHFVDLLLQRRGILPAAGGTVRTTLDLDLNRQAERALTGQLAQIADKHATGGAVVVIDNPTGEVLALAGSGDYFRPGSGQVNGAWIVRSPGSAVKPFTYLLALERGANPGTVVPDVPTDFNTSTGLYRPNNYNHRFYGPVSLRFALGNSLNVAAIRALELAGGPESLHRFLRGAGITTLDHPAEWFGPGLTLGNGEVRLLELAHAFSTLARLGLHRPYRLLLDTPGETAPAPRIADARATWLLADMLADNTARAASFGLNSYLAFDFPVACKTGTSSDYRDNWAVGYTPEFTVAVWVGNPDGSPMRGITGVTGAAPVMHEIFLHLKRTRGTSWFAMPDGIVTETVHPLTGHRVAAGRPGAVREKCLWPVEPERESDYDPSGRVVLPPEYAAWLAGPQNSLGNLVAGTGAGSSLRILHPAPGTVYLLDPDLPADSQWVPLRAEAANLVQWSCASLPCDPAANGHRVQIAREGRHVITAFDSVTGRTAETWIEVKGM